jgi:nucleotide-binding universal stress UspA family protein
MSILVGLNPARRSESLLYFAAMLARSVDTDLIVTVVVPQGWSPIGARNASEWDEYTRQAAQIVLDHAKSVLGDELNAEYVLHEAVSARKGLLELVDAHDVGMLVVGSALDGPVGRITLGSVNDALLHASPVPVAVAPRGYRVAPDARVTRVTAAYSGTGASADLVIGAAGIAGAAGGSLRIASFAVLPHRPLTARTGNDIERAIIADWEQGIRASVDELGQEILELPKVPTETTAVVGMGESWVEAVDDIEWKTEDVLVVGSSSLAPIARVFLGSHATKVVRNSPVPVVVVPRRAAAELAEDAQMES